MAEDHGTNDAASGAVPGSDAAVPVTGTPAALTDKDLDKVAGGMAFTTVTNAGNFPARTKNSFGTTLK